MPLKEPALLIFCVLWIASNVSGRDECPEVVPFPNFDPQKFIADWHVSYYLRPANEPERMNCGHIQIFIDPSDHLLHGNITAIEDDGSLFQREGKVNVYDPENPGRLTIVETNLGRASEFTLTIVDIDYDSHAAYVICAIEPDGMVHKRVGIVGRKYNLPEAIVEELKGKITAQGIDITGMKLSPCKDA